jgi:regulator of RNase E activity RraA
MSETAHARGVAGTVVNGACRDVAVAAAVGYPLWSVSRFMRTGEDGSGASWPTTTAP